MCMVPEGLNQNSRMKKSLHLIISSHPWQHSQFMASSATSNSRNVPVSLWTSCFPVCLLLKAICTLLEILHQYCFASMTVLHLIRSFCYSQLDLGTLPITINPGVPIAISFLHCIIVFHTGESQKYAKYYYINWCI